MVDTSRWVMKFFREERMRGVRALAGDRYTPNASFKQVYVNLISLYVDIVGRSLFTKSPRVMLSTFEKSDKASVSAAETWMNQELVRQDFASTMQRLVTDALFNIGIAKICLATPHDAAVSGWGLKAGSAYLSRVDVDDFVFDHRARDISEARYIGNRYRMPLEMAKDNPAFNKEARERLQGKREIAYNKEGDERIGQIGRHEDYYLEDLEEMVDLWEIYCPQHRVVKTFAESDLTGPTSAWEKSSPMALEEKNWIGHDRGPYPILAYGLVPGNPFPIGPIQKVINLSDVANECYRKLVRQAKRLKVLSVANRVNPSDADEVRKTDDGGFALLSDPNSVREIVMGGPHQGLFQITIEFVKRFMEMAGNLTTMGGLATQAGTLGQEELLAQQSNGQVASMQDATASFVSQCTDRMLWYFWNDPRMVMRSPVNDPSLPDVDFVREVHPWSAPSHMVDQQTGMKRQLNRRTGPKPDLKIDPHSMRHMTPQQRARDLQQIVTQIFVPLSSLAQQQGVSFDFNAFLGIMAKYMDAPDLPTILTIKTPSTAGDSTEGSSGPAPPAPQTTTHIRKDAGPTQRAEKMQQDNQISAMAAMSNGQQNGKPRY